MIPPPPDHKSKSPLLISRNNAFIYRPRTLQCCGSGKIRVKLSILFIKMHATLYSISWRKYAGFLYPGKYSYCFKTFFCSLRISFHIIVCFMFLKKMRLIWIVCRWSTLQLRYKKSLAFLRCTLELQTTGVLIL